MSPKTIARQIGSMLIRFRLRTLLMVVAVVAIALAVAAMDAKRVKRNWLNEQQVIASLEQVGGEGFITLYRMKSGWPSTVLFFEDDRVFDRVVRYEGPLRELTDSQLRDLSTLRELRELLVPYSPLIGDKGISYVATLPRLEVLDIHEAGITDAGLLDIGRIESLRVLCISDTAVTDQGMKHLLKLSHLQDLSLAGTSITDRGLRLFSQFPHLEELSVQDTAVSDAGLDSISKIPNLKRVWVDGTQITKAAIKTFRFRNPQIVIHDQ